MFPAGAFWGQRVGLAIGFGTGLGTEPLAVPTEFDNGETRKAETAAVGAEADAEADAGLSEPGGAAFRLG